MSMKARVADEWLPGGGRADEVVGLEEEKEREGSE